MHVFAKGFYNFCWHVNIAVSPSTTAPVGSKVNVSITDMQYDCTNCPGPTFCEGLRGNNYILTESGVTVNLGLQGPAWFDSVSAPPEQRQASFFKQITQAHTVSGEAWALVGVGSDEAQIVFSVDDVFFGSGSSTYEPNTVTITGFATPAVASLLLYPSKAYRHVHDSITLTAKALDASGQPVANAPVSFATFGDCKPTLDTVVRNTNAAGYASVTLQSNKPGAVAVVAAAVNDQGVAVLSQPSHVFFYEEHRYVEEREPKYYGGHHHSGDGHHHAATHGR